MTKGTLFVISAASGTGKTSLVSELTKILPNITTSISYTTRSPRSGEMGGKHYHFVTPAKFNEMLDNGEFIEHAKIFGHYYGTSRIDLEKLLIEGTDIVLELDWQGAFQLRSIMPEVISVFILPPSWEALRQRIVARNQDEQAVIERRLQTAASEIVHCKEYDYIIVNDEFHQALDELLAIVKARRSHQRVNSEEIERLLKDLLL